MHFNRLQHININVGMKFIAVFGYSLKAVVIHLTKRNQVHSERIDF